MHQLILQNISKYIQLTAEEEDHFISILQLKKLRKRQYLVQAGDECRYECFVQKGCLRQYYVDDKGFEHIVMFAPEDWWVSDMYGLISGKPSLTNVDALEDSELLLIERHNFEELLIKVPKFERFFPYNVTACFCWSATPHYRKYEPCSR